MRLRSSRYIVAFISLLVFLFAGQAGVQGYVLCVADSGHIEFESSINGSCGSGVEKKADHSSQALEFALPFGDDHCGPCLDFSATNEITSARYQLKKSLFPHAEGPVFHGGPTPVFPTRLQPAKAPGRIFPRVSQTILAHRTVVLLN